MSEWHYVDSIPRDRAVFVRTVTGIECLAKVQRGARFGKAKVWGINFQKIACWRRDGHSGDLMAIGWKYARAH